MKEKKNRLGRTQLLLLIFFAGAPLFAGDVACFVDLGFSGDGLVYSFAQYGVLEESLMPWAELYFVDVRLNDFKKDGRLLYKHDRRIDAGQDGSGALFKLLSDNTARAASYGLDFLRQGVPLFISFESNPYDGTAGFAEEIEDAIEFRDFDEDVLYKAKLYPSFYESGGTFKSSFYIKLERGEESPAEYKVGTPEIKRADITSYIIRKVIVTPDRKSMIFVIEMTRRRPDAAPGDISAPAIRYMVEAVRF